MNDVAIVGVGQSSFYRRESGMSIRELCYVAFNEAMQGLNLSNKDIDASITCSAPDYDKQRSPSGMISEYLELTPKPAFYVESVCSSSTTGVRVAYSLIKSGLHKVVAVIGFQKMSEISSRDGAAVMGRGADITWEAPFGITMPSGYALFAQAHMAKYGTTEQQLAKVRVKNASYAAKNPKAVYRKEVTLEDVMASTPLAKPLKMLDATMNADGASCVIIAAADVAKSVSKIPVWIAGLGAATDTMTMSGRKTFTSLSCAKDAAAEAYKMAGVKPRT
jgi:acetyl-CoA C-acetyltransferase